MTTNNNDINIANNVAQRNSQDLERVADTSKTIDHIVDVTKKVSLTEQWKKGELEDGEYYIKSNKGDIYIDICANGSFMFTNYRSIEEVLAPVPSYEEWQQMKAFCEEFNALEVAKENQQLKELLKECKPYVIRNVVFTTINKGEEADLESNILLTKIEEVLK